MDALKFRLVNKGQLGDNAQVYVTPVKCVCDMQYSYPATRLTRTMFSQQLSVCLSVRPSNMTPVLEVLIPFNMSVAWNLCFLCNLKITKPW